MASPAGTKKKDDTTRFPLETLQKMELPEVPEAVSKLLSVTWKGRGGVPAPSAVGAMTDSVGNPLVVMTLVYKNSIIEEEHPHKDSYREAKILIEVAEELL